MYGSSSSSAPQWARPCSPLEYTRSSTPGRDPFYSLTHVSPHVLATQPSMAVTERRRHTHFFSFSSLTANHLFSLPFPFSLLTTYPSHMSHSSVLGFRTYNQPLYFNTDNTKPVGFLNNTRVGSLTLTVQRKCRTCARPSFICPNYSRSNRIAESCMTSTRPTRSSN